MNQRRQFLKQSAVLSLSPLVPTFLNSACVNAENISEDSEGKILVVIQLSGGNDGINTVIPFADEGYAKNRSSLRIAENDLIKLTDEIGLHSRFRSISELFSQDRLSFVHGVGYPNPNRSHFESMSIWHTASTDAEVRASEQGWLGNVAKSAQAAGADSRRAIYVGNGELPVALRGRNLNATSMTGLQDMHLVNAESNANTSGGSGDLSDFVTNSVADAYASAKELSELTESDTAAQYPGSRLAGRLKTISQMIKAGLGGQIFYTNQSGYDTHSAQSRTHGNLLGTLSSSLKAFMNDMRDSGLEDRVLVMAFSEFGRRVNENASEGTDHGTAGPMILAGTKLKERFYGEVPSLTKLVDGDVQHTTDFRDIYANILTSWLGLKPAKNLEGFGKTKLFLG